MGCFLAQARQSPDMGYDGYDSYRLLMCFWIQMSQSLLLVTVSIMPNYGGGLVLDVCTLQLGGLSREV